MEQIVVAQKTGIRWQTLLRLLVGIAALTVLGLHIGKAREIATVFLSVRVDLLVLAFFWMVLNFFLQFHKWRFILRRHCPDIRNAEVFGSLIAGFTLGIITPGRLGELGRGFFLRGRNKWLLTGLSLIDKMSNNVAILILGSLAFYFYLKEVYSLSIFVLWPYSGLVLLVWLGLGLLIYRLTDIASWLEKKVAAKPRLRRLRPFFVGLEAFDVLSAGKLLAYSVAIYLVIFIQFVTLLRAMAPVPFLPALAGVAATMFSKTLLPVSLGDLGVREAAAVYFLHQVGVARVQAFDAALMLFGMNILLPSVLGVFLIPRLSLVNGGENATASG